jgi:hypothetical protein
LTGPDATAAMEASIFSTLFHPGNLLPLMPLLDPLLCRLACGLPSRRIRN